MIAPSGKFCNAIPTESANASMMVILPLCKNPAKTTPTAIPSGILCSVTAKTSIVVFLSFECTPSTCSDALCKCGTILSIKSKNATPSKKPILATIGEPCDCSMAGSNSDQTAALIITPLAKPKRAMFTEPLISFFKKNTHAEPRVVPKKGKRSPIARIIVIDEKKLFIILLYCSMIELEKIIDIY